VRIIKYKKIIEYLKEEINEDRILPGQKLPSVRNLSQIFNCANATVVKAYNKLKNENIIYSVSGSGHYLIGKKMINEEEDNDKVDFSGTTLDKNSLPYQEFQACINQAIKKYQNNLFSYGDPKGLLTLRMELRKSLEKNQVFTDEDRIFITSGSQQAIDILSKMPFPGNKNKVVIEQPTYKGIIKSLSLNNIEFTGVNRNFSGLDFESLEEKFKRGKIKFFYTVPRFSNPLGLSYTKEDKLKLLSLANKYDVYIIEDDYLADLGSKEKNDPIFYYDINDRVIYLKTFSKVLSPGLRIAVVVMPESLSKTFIDYKYWTDISTPVLSQGALKIYLKSGMFVAHTQKLHNLYMQRMNFLVELTENKDPNSIKWYINQNGGFYASLKILNNNKADKIIKNLKRKNIKISNMRDYYNKEFYNNKIMRISIANTSLKELRKGIDLLRNEIKRESIFY